MGTGRSGISKGIKQGKNLSEFRMTARNVKDYNMQVAPRLKKNVPEEYLNRAFETFNEMAKILGMDPNILPTVKVDFTTRSGIFGDCRMVSDWEKLNADALIRLHPDMFSQSNYDTFAHEYVHALEAWIIKTNLANDADRHNAWANDLYSEAMCRNALFKMGKNPGATLDKTVWKTEAATIKLNQYDTYAQSAPSETLTRAVQSVLRFGNNASPFAKHLVAELKLEVTSLQKKRKKQ